MAGEFIKPSGITPAILGTIANPDDYNQNIAGQSKSSLVGIDVDGSFADFDIGDESLVANGALAKDIKLREGYYLKYYNASGVFQRNVNLGQATTTLIGQTLLPKKITISNNGTDSEHDIDFSGGTFNFDDGSGQAIATALTKQIDAAWVAGDNQGGLDTGTVAADTTYYMFAIWNPTSQVADYLFSTSIDSPTLPSGYTKKKRIAALCTNGSSNIINLIYSFKPDGSYIAQLKTPILDVNASNSQGTTAVNYTLTVPNGLKLKVIVNVAALDGFSNAGVYLSDPDTTNLAPSTSAAPLFTSYDSDGGGSANNIVQASCFTNTSAQIRARADLTLDNFRIATLSFEDFINE